MPQPIQLRVLLSDDDDIVRMSVAGFLTIRDHQFVEAKNGVQALEYLAKDNFDVVITDIKMPGADGFEILYHTRKNASNTEIIMITGFGDIQLAVLRSEARERHGLNALIGQSPPVRKVKDLIKQVAQTEATSVLVQGETGTGKEVAARAIHHESNRAGSPFVAIDCTAIPDNLFESEFYGHEKGAFTDARDTHRGYFEQADTGTLFLDEIGDMPLDMQVRLLRTLEERHIRRVGGSHEIPVDVRVISATNQDLETAISASRFREDLYHRINTFVINLPPLRDRSDDIQLLAKHYFDLYVREVRKPIADFSPEAWARLQEHPFLGNVRELKNTVERAVILCQGDQIKPENLQFSPLTTPSSAPLDKSDVNTVLQALPDIALELDQAEAQIIREALRRCNWNKGQTADLLGLSRYALRRRMKAHNIE